MHTTTPAMDWTAHLATRTQRIQPSVIREILKLTQKPNVISFAGGLPAPNLFPTEAIKEASVKVLDQYGAQALQYSTTEGHLPLRQWVAQDMSTSGHQVDPEHVQIVSGSQQALDLVAKVLLNPGDKVAVGAPTYMGALRAFDPYEVTYVHIACDEEGFIPESLAEVLSQGVKLIYAIANFDNPTGIRMSLARRQQLISLARQYQTPIFEDDPYGELRYAGERLPHLYELAPDQVIYASSFSKTVVPGFRLAWLVCDDEALGSLITRAKQALDLHTSTYLQMIAADMVQGTFMAEQIERVRHYYHQQRDLMLTAIRQYFPAEISYTTPEGGMFLWCELPLGSDTIALLDKAVEQQVAYVPGEPFYACGGGEHTLRLSYSVATPEEIDSGIRRLGEMFKAELLSSAEAYGLV